MSEDKTKLKFDTLRPQILEPLKFFADKLTEQLGSYLQSISVIGSSLTDDFDPRKSDINTVLVLSSYSSDSLKVLAGMAKPMSKKKITAPLLMTADYIERSRDVFGIELLDFQLIHQTIHGDDPFAQLTFTKEHIRLQCERELKATLIRLRQGYIASAAHKKFIRDILISAATGLVPLLRAMLWLNDIERPKTIDAVFTQAAEKFQVNIDSLRQVRKWRQEKSRPDQIEISTAFEAIYKTVEKLALTVDKLKV